MAENNNLSSTVEAFCKNMEGFLSSETVVGKPIDIGGTILVPLMDVTFGMGAGSFAGEKKRNSGGGMGGKLSPSAVLVIRDGITKMVSLKNSDSISKLLDMIPDFVNKFMSMAKEKKYGEAYAEAREEAAEDLKEKLDIEE